MPVIYRRYPLNGVEVQHALRHWPGLFEENVRRFPGHNAVRLPRRCPGPSYAAAACYCKTPHLPACPSSNPIPRCKKTNESYIVHSVQEVFWPAKCVACQALEIAHWRKPNSDDYISIHHEGETLVERTRMYINGEARAIYRHERVRWKTQVKLDQVKDLLYRVYSSGIARGDDSGRLEPLSEVEREGAIAIIAGGGVRCFWTGVVLSFVRRHDSMEKGSIDRLFSDLSYTDPRQVLLPASLFVNMFLSDAPPLTRIAIYEQMKVGVNLGRAKKLSESIVRENAEEMETDSDDSEVESESDEDDGEDEDDGTDSEGEGSEMENEGEDSSANESRAESKDSDSEGEDEETPLCRARGQYWTRKFLTSRLSVASRNSKVRRKARAGANDYDPLDADATYDDDSPPYADGGDPFEVTWSRDDLLRRIEVLEDCDEVLGMESVSYGEVGMSGEGAPMELRAGMDRMANDMPYDGDSVMIMPWAYNSAKSCCSVFKTTKSLRRASRSAGMNMRDFTRTTFAKWTVKFLRAFPIESLTALLREREEAGVTPFQ